jgi:hypothetical protein
MPAAICCDCRKTGKEVLNGRDRPNWLRPMSALSAGVELALLYDGKLDVTQMPPE